MTNERGAAETAADEELLGTLDVEITQEGIDAYAEVAGDFNPIHVDPVYAAGTAFGGTVAHGFYVLSFGSVLLTRLYGRRWIEGGGIEVRFRRPARPGDRMTVSAWDGGTATRRGRPCRVVAVRWEDQNRQAFIEGTAHVPE